MPEMGPPPHDSLLLVLYCAGPLALHFGFGQLSFTIVEEIWLPPRDREFILASIVTLYFERFLSLLQSTRR